MHLLIALNLSDHLLHRFLMYYCLVRVGVSVPKKVFGRLGQGSVLLRLINAIAHCFKFDFALHLL